MSLTPEDLLNEPIKSELRTSVITQRAYIESEILALTQFVKTDEYTHLLCEEKIYISKQLFHMEIYRSILTARILKFYKV